MKEAIDVLGAQVLTEITALAASQQTTSSATSRQSIDRKHRTKRSTRAADDAGFEFKGSWPPPGYLCRYLATRGDMPLTSVCDCMPTVSLHSFLATGNFGNVRSGWTRQQLENELGSPEAHGGESRKHRYPTIWKYGDIEFVFEPGRRDGYLYMVFFDAFDVPHGWGKLVIEPWKISNSLTLEAGKSVLCEENIEYEVAQSPDPDCVNLVTASGVQLQFVVRQPDAYSFPIGLFAVCKQLAEPPPGNDEKPNNNAVS